MKLLHIWKRFERPGSHIIDGYYAPPYGSLAVVWDLMVLDQWGQWCVSNQNQCPIRVAKVDKQYFISNITTCHSAGPYPTWQAALRAADTMHALKEYP